MLFLPRSRNIFLSTGNLHLYSQKLDKICILLLIWLSVGLLSFHVTDWELLLSHNYFVEHFSLCVYCIFCFPYPPTSEKVSFFTSLLHKNLLFLASSLSLSLAQLSWTMLFLSGPVCQRVRAYRSFGLVSDLAKVCVYSLWSQNIVWYTPTQLWTVTYSSNKNFVDITWLTGILVSSILSYEQIRINWLNYLCVCGERETEI